MKLKVERLLELPEMWQQTMTAAVNEGHPIESLVFVEHKDGTLERFKGPLDVERKTGHCIIVRGVGERDGQSYANITYALPVPTGKKGQGS